MFCVKQKTIAHLFELDVGIFMMDISKQPVTFAYAL